MYDAQPLQYLRKHITEKHRKQVSGTLVIVDYDTKYKKQTVLILILILEASFTNNAFL